HCHSKFSDGSCGIEYIVSMAKRCHLDFISITDHDNISSISRVKVLSDRLNINIIVGVELSAYDYKRNAKVHILCYMPQIPDRLEGICLKTTTNRKNAGIQMAKNVTANFPITMHDIEEISSASPVIYKQHIMQALMNAGYTNQIFGSLFDKLFSKETGTCLVKYELPDVYEVIDLVKQSGGLAVMAHPNTYNSMDLLKELIEEKLLDGIEVWSSKSTPQQELELYLMAIDNNLMPFGGSDFHGAYIKRPSPIGYKFTPPETMDKIAQLYFKSDAVKSVR
ncbi:MAG: PHP domain-containing protein, partial [Oscillospiraceae bacterium]